MGMGLGKLRELEMDREAWRAGHKESDTTERLNWTEAGYYVILSKGQGAGLQLEPYHK